jgi:hypothetical protein
MSGAKMNYDFGPKRHWRRWVWNRIAEMTPSRRDALVAYLPGARDFDKPIATALGFRANNMIGLERDKDALGQARSCGALVVGADFFDGVDALCMRGSSIDVVFGDFCGGFSHRLIGTTAGWTSLGEFTTAVFAFNMLRGREFDPTLKPLYKMVGDSAREYGIDGHPNHRGMALAINVCGVIARLLIENKQANGWDVVDLGVALLEEARPRFHTYKSDTQIFDSVVFKNPLPSLFEGPGNGAASVYGKSGVARDKKVVAAKRSVAAVMAHRTMREGRIGIYA